jgi:hypothetical protein
MGPLTFGVGIDPRLKIQKADEPLFNSLIEQHHYLGYEQPVGEHLKYLAWARGRPLACLAWSSAPRHLGSRDRFIGWCAEARHRNIRFLAYNTRFLILPWVQVEHLASHILGRMAKRLSQDWERLYGHPISFWRLSSIRSGFAGRVTERRTGCYWDEPRAGARTIRRIVRTVRSKRCWAIPSSGDFASCWRRFDEASRAAGNYPFWPWRGVTRKWPENWLPTGRNRERFLATLATDQFTVPCGLSRPP